MGHGVDVEASLHRLLKSYDRIGFGRRGVLDAEGEIRRFAAGLAAPEQSSLRRVILSWLETEEAERVTASLHYNLPEHLQELALRLCASLPIPESRALLRRLLAREAFHTEEAKRCRVALQDTAARLGVTACAAAED